MSEIRVKPDGDGLIVELEGPLTKAEAEGLVNAVGAASPLRLVLNFSGAGRINTAFLAGLLWAVRAVARTGGHTRAHGLTEQVRKVFEVMGLTQYIEVSD